LISGKFCIVGASYESHVQSKDSVGKVKV